eukprot:5321597-Pyramimonas_sp.AAC.1
MAPRFTAHSCVNNGETTQNAQAVSFLPFYDSHLLQNRLLKLVYPLPQSWEQMDTRRGPGRAPAHITTMVMNG